MRTDGLGVLAGTVRRLHADVLRTWGGTRSSRRRQRAVRRHSRDARVYFVHSYAASTTIRRRARRARLHASISSPPSNEALAATQFHPEKSGDVGAALLEKLARTL